MGETENALAKCAAGFMGETNGTSKGKGVEKTKFFHASFS